MSATQIKGCKTCGGKRSIMDRANGDKLCAKCRMAVMYGPDGTKTFDTVAYWVATEEAE